MLRKRFGQNFLHDANVKRRIVDVVDPQSDEHFVEIGPGDGALTKLFLPKVEKLDAVEIDRDLVAELEKYTGEFENFKIHSADALKFDFAKLYQEKPLRIIGNLPYNISTPLLFHLLKFVSLISDMHFMLQKEVAERIFAKPRTKQYGRLSVMLQYHLHGEILFKVSKNSFYPVPKVESAFLKLVPHSELLKLKDYGFFSKVVKAAFGMRRKTLANALKPILTVDQLGLLGDFAKRRAEELSVEEFVKLTALFD